MKHSHTPLLILAISVTCVVGALYVYMYEATASAVDRASAARDVVASEQSDQLQARALAGTMTSTAVSRDRLSSFFIPSDNVVLFITSLEALGSQSKSTVSIASVDADPLTGAQPGTIAHAHAHISAHGSWESVVTLLSLAERMPFDSQISHVRLSASGPDKTKQPAWDVSFDVQASILVVAPVTQ